MAQTLDTGATKTQRHTDMDTKHQEMPHTPKKENNQLPGWILGWFYATAIICTWDASFIMLRPYSLPGGSMAWLFYAYKFYVTVDQRYMDSTDAFVFAQSLLNYAEVVLNIITIIMHYRSSRHTIATAFTVSVMTMWKTVLYFLMFSDFCTGSQYRQGNTAFDEFFLVVIPNGVWIVLPLVAMIVLWERLLPTTTEPQLSELEVKAVSEKNVKGDSEAELNLLTTSGDEQRFSKRDIVRGPGAGLVLGSVDGLYSRDLSKDTDDAVEKDIVSKKSNLTRRSVARPVSDRL